MIDSSSFRIDIIKIIKKELKFVTEKHSERIEEYKAKHRLEKLEGKKVYDKPVIRTGDKAGCYGSGLTSNTDNGLGFETFLFHLGNTCCVRDSFQSLWSF